MGYPEGKTMTKNGVSNNSKSLGYLTRPDSWALHRDIVDAFQWEYVWTPRSWYQVKETEGSALIDTEISFTVREK